jgi:hypothetical protein
MDCNSATLQLWNSALLQLFESYEENRRLIHLDVTAIKQIPDHFRTLHVNHATFKNSGIQQNKTKQNRRF